MYKKFLFLIFVFLTKNAFAVCSITATPYSYGNYGISAYTSGSGQGLIRINISGCKTNYNIFIGNPNAINTATLITSPINTYKPDGTTLVTSTSDAELLSGTNTLTNCSKCALLNIYVSKLNSQINVTPGLYSSTVMLRASVREWNNGDSFTTDSFIDIPVSISVQVQPFCSFSAISGLDFGPYSSSSIKISSLSFNTTCATGINYSISFDGGSSGDINNRQMRSGSNTINYNIYHDFGTYNSLIGDGITGTKINKTGSGGFQQNNVYGKMPAGQSAPPGTYSDTINLTLTY